MTTKATDKPHVEKVLEAKDARVQQFGNVNIYSWDEQANANSFVDWLMGPLAGSAVNGGVHIHGWNHVYVTDTYPPDANHWRIGVYNTENYMVDVTVYALSLT